MRATVDADPLMLTGPVIVADHKPVLLKRHGQPQRRKGPAGDRPSRS